MGSEGTREAAEPRWVTIDGERIAYRVAGSGPLLLLVHGMAGSSQTWAHVMGPLAQRFEVLAPDLLGQGESDRPHGEYSLGVHANMLRDLLDRLGYEGATVVGQSLGGGVALQFAYQFPERCERLVLVDAGGLGPEVSGYLRMLSIPGFQAAFPLLCSTPVIRAGERVAGWLSRLGLPPSAAGSEIWRSYASLADADRRRAFFRNLRDVVDVNGQAVSALGRLQHTEVVPTLVVWGANDPFIPVSHARVARDAIPGSRVEVFEGVGHYPHCEAPERFVEVVVDFIDSTEPARLPPRSLQADSEPREGD